MYSDNSYIRQAGDEPVLTTTANYHHKTVEGIDKGISRINHRDFEYKGHKHILLFTLMYYQMID